MKLFKLDEKIRIKVHEVEMVVSPLSLQQKIEIMTQQELFNQTSKVEHLLNAGRLSLKYALKDIKNITLSDGSEFKLEFDEKGVCEDHLELLMNCSYNDEFITSCLSITKGIPEEIKDINGNKLEGVEIINFLDKPKRKRKPTQS